MGLPTLPGNPRNTSSPKKKKTIANKSSKPSRSEVNSTGGAAPSVRTSTQQAPIITPGQDNLQSQGYFEPETILISEGVFWMGSSREPDSEHERPQHQVHLPAYRIGKYPVTNFQYYQFIRESNYPVVPEMGWNGQRPPDGAEKLPVTGVNWYDAMQYCSWLTTKTGRSYSLPNEAQWEKACRGTSNFLYPWGDQLDRSRSNYGNTTLAAVDAYPAQSEYGCFDLVGNVRQWTRTLWGEKRTTPDAKFLYPWKEDGRNYLRANRQIRRVVRGCSFRDDMGFMRSTARSGQLPDDRGPSGTRFGFRVIMLTDVSDDDVPETVLPETEELEKLLVLDQAVYISYAWSGESEEIANYIQKGLHARGIQGIRDKRELDYTGSITKFMDQIGMNHCVIVVINDTYLRSPNCMLELVELTENKQFHDRTFPVVSADANIYDPVYRTWYIEFWEQRISQLADARKKFDRAEPLRLPEELDEEMELYNRIKDTISRLPGIFKDMNILIPGVLSEANFGELYDAIEKRLEPPIDPEAEQARKRQLAFEANILENNRSQAVFNDQAQGEDQLGIKNEVEALAETLLLRDVEPPVAVGIMGGWGSGKSFVMYLISRYVEEIRAKIVKKGWPDPGKEKEKDPRIPAYVGHIYQIHFNAWTYAKSNLWASLMDTIFTCLNRQMQLERLFAHQDIEEKDFPESNASQEQKERYQSAVSDGMLKAGECFKKIYQDDYQIALDSVLTDETKTRLSGWSGRLLNHNLLWQVMRNQNEKELKKIQEEEKKLEQDKARRDALDNARQMEPLSMYVLEKRVADTAYFALLQETLLRFMTDLVDHTVSEEFKKQGIKKEKLIELEKDAETAVKGTQGLINAFRQSRYYWMAGLSIAAIAFAFPYIRSWLGQPIINQWISRSITLVASITPLLPTFLARWQKIVDFQLETKKAFEKGYEAQQSRRAEEIAAENCTFEEKVEKLENEIKQGSLPACNVLIRLKENRIEQQRVKIGPAARYPNLLEFVQSRLDAATYENQLGLMHQVRQDVDELTYSLVSSANKDIFPRGKPRVLLYIDDLDRCPPQRVVEILEAVQLLLNTKLFVVILGLDTRYVTRALEKEYKEILQHEGDPSGLDYIEKIIQIPYRVRPIERDSLQNYLAMQMDIEKPPGPERSTISRTEVPSTPNTQIPPANTPAPVDQPEPVTPSTAEPVKERSTPEPVPAQEGSTEESRPVEIELPAAVVQFKPDDLADLTVCCQQISLTPRSIKRVVNVFKLMKIFWFRAGEGVELAKRDQPRPVKQGAICLLALSSAYPEVMREVFVYLEGLYRCGQEQTRLFAALNNIKLPPGSAHELAWQFQSFKQDVSTLRSMPSDSTDTLDQLTLDQLKFSTFNLVRSFSFVGDPVYWTDDEENGRVANGHMPVRRVAKVNRN